MKRELLEQYMIVSALGEMLTVAEQELISHTVFKDQDDEILDISNETVYSLTEEERSVLLYSLTKREAEKLSKMIKDENKKPRLPVQIKLAPGAKIPTRATEGAAGFDVYAYIDEPITCSPGEKVMIPTGVMAALPEGYYWDGRARSGISTKHSLILLNGAAVIDEDFRGVTQFAYFNLGGEPYTFEPGERIGQLILTAYETPEFQEVDILPETIRGTGGFGHTGRK